MSHFRESPCATFSGMCIEIGAGWLYFALAFALYFLVIANYHAAADLPVERMRANWAGVMR